jgi:acyl-CoA thioesterase
MENKMGFSQASAVTPAATGFVGEIFDGWGVAGNANGGYLMAMAARAMAAAADRPHPIAINAHFLSPGRPGKVHIQTSISKVGRRFSTVRGTLSSSDRPLLELLGSFGDLGGIEGPQLVDAQPPELPPPEDCVRHLPGPSGFPPPLLAQVDLRLHPEDATFVEGKPSGRPLFRGWLRIPDEPIDAFALLLAVDIFPPTVFNANLPMRWTPTVELSAHVRGIPVGGWLRCRFSTRFISGGMLEEDAEIWDDSGRLVAQSRQLALTPLA